MTLDYLHKKARDGAKPLAPGAFSGYYEIVPQPGTVFADSTLTRADGGPRSLVTGCRSW